MADLPFPRGVRDLLPNEALFKNELLRKFEEVYRRFGFVTIDTPVFESLDILRAKNAIGEESKLIYEMKDENLGLRYDHTVSLARYYAMHQEVPLPFKRYFIGKAWRREEPQKGRYREFMQADIDILGGRPIYTDAEIIGTASKALEAIGVGFEIKLNDRRIVDMILKKLGVKEELYKAVYRAVDKLDKLEVDDVAKLLVGAGLETAQIDGLVNMINLKGRNAEKMDYLKSFVGADNKIVEEFSALQDAIQMYRPDGIVNVDFSLVRGIDYYTSTTFEFKCLKEGVRRSIGGGGRYDKLIELYSGKKVPAVGTSFGVDVIANEVLNSSASLQYTYAKVMVNYVREGNFGYAFGIANELRKAGINTDINLAARNIANQLAYANSVKFAYAIIVGDDEQKNNVLKLRNLSTGEEITMTLEEVVAEMTKQ